MFIQYDFIDIFDMIHEAFDVAVFRLHISPLLFAATDFAGHSLLQMSSAASFFASVHIFASKFLLDASSLLLPSAGFRLSSSLDERHFA